ncbi:MAG: hypothetical protein GX911_05725 [Spirochaetales bacterium]|nr:hypothetical protein [Spirochaetales bacterium]
MNNRRTLSFLLVFMLVPVLLHARVFDRFAFTVSNDWHTPNIGYNVDDGMTCGAHIQAGFVSGLTMKLDGVSFTDKLTTETRFDLISLGAFHPFRFSLRSLEVTMTPHLSFMVAGNFGFRTIQNSWHLLRRIPILRIDYLDADTLFTAQGGGVLSLFFPFGHGGLDAHIGFTIAFEWVNRFEATIAYHPDHATRIDLSYRHLDLGDLHPTLGDYLDRYRGFEISFTHTSGPLAEFFLIYPAHNISYGSYAFNILGFNEEKTFIKADWTYSFGFALDNRPGVLQLFEISYRGFGLEIWNTSGSIKNDAGMEIARHQGGLYALSYRFEPFDHPLLTPYLKPFGGIQRFVYLENLVPTIEHYLPAIGLELGLLVGKEDDIVFGGTAWRPCIGATAHYLFFHDRIASLFPEVYTHPKNRLQLGLLIALEIGHDMDALRTQSRRPERALAPYLP